MKQCVAETEIVLRVFQACDGERPVGFTVVAVETGGERVRYMELAQFSRNDLAEARIEEIRRFIVDWELITGVRRELEEIAAQFSIHDGLGGEWLRMGRRESESFVLDANFALNYAGGYGFQPDLDEAQRLVMNAPKLLSLIENRCETLFEEALDVLSEETGRSLSRAGALDIAAKWGPSQISRERLDIEIVPAVGDLNEPVGFLVVGLLYDGTGGALVFDLMDAEMEEIDARLAMGSVRMAVESMRRVPFHTAHRDGLRPFFDETRRMCGTDKWEPFALDAVDLQIFLAWGSPLARGSYGIDGTTRRVDVPQLLDDVFGPSDPVRMEQMRASLGCVDRC